MVIFGALKFCTYAERSSGFIALAQPSGTRPACQRGAIFLPLQHLPSNYIISTSFYSPTMEQFPLRGPKDGAISLQALGTSAAISIAPLQHACRGSAMEIAPS